MDPKQRPQGREKYTTGESKGVHRRGEGLGTGPVGNAGSNPFHSNPQGQRPPSGSTGGQATRASGGRGGIIGIILAAIVAIGGGGGLLGLFGGGGGTEVSPTDLSGSGGSGYQNTSPATLAPVSGGQSVSAAVAAGSREKYTRLLGNGRDQVNVMVYMCGTDLESKHSMGTNDLMEMTKAKLGDNVRVLVYTGGCKKWNNNLVSAAKNQIYEVTGGGLKCLVDDMGSDTLIKPETLTSFIKWCGEHYPANRNELILWDHGGGSVTGYGYDEKYPYGSMSLNAVDKALKDAGMKFDFIGFDACLMATVETGLVLDKYADYMVASEETEPGVGWYYTDWLTALSANPSMPTTEIGKNIADTFVSTCAQVCRGQSCTLSVVDLAELSNTAPAPLKSFAESLSTMIEGNDYSAISSARSGAREFARSSAIDQIDLADFASRVGNREGAALAQALGGAVKYNRTSSNMTRCYGLSIYFPYRKTSKVDSAVDAYNAIGMDDSYTRAIRQFASLEVGGQVSTGGFDTSALGSLLGGVSSAGSASGGGADMIGGLLSAFLGGGSGGFDFFSDRALDMDKSAAYIASHMLDSSLLTWKTNAAGEKVISLPDEQWELVNEVCVNMFYDDGAGFVDLGMDEGYDWDDDGALRAATDRLWLSVNNQPVAYYHLFTDDGATTGYIPALLNGDRVELLVIFDGDHPRGAITGARDVYKNGETDAVAKNLTAIEDGDTLEFLCDYYTYGGLYQDSYLLGQPLTVNGPLRLSYEDVGTGGVRLTYRFTDIYHQNYWSEPLNL